MRPEGNFSVGLSNALLEVKHYRAMGEALWLYTYLLDRQGRKVDANGFGKVAGGMPIRDSDIAGTFGSSRRTIIRWREILVRGDYITARRTSFGHVYAITKPKKWKKATASDVTQPAHHNDGDVTQPVTRCDITCTNKEEIQRVTVVAATAVSENQMEGELQKVWDYYLDAFKKDEIISPSKKKMGLDVFFKLRPDVNRVEVMAGAIDMAHHIVKHHPEKSYLGKWTSIFKNFDTFLSLYEESRDPKVPTAASLSQ